MPKSKKYDFCGWATKNDVKCSDGRTIKKDAFIEDDGQIVPLVWNHDHGDPSNVLGHAELQNRDEGVYAYCSFNDTEAGNTAKELVKHGDVTRLSIYANKLKQVGGDVIHGAIREVSLVLAGANKEAIIDNVFMHSDTGEPESAFISTTSDGDICHSDEEIDEEEKKKKIKKDSEEIKDEEKKSEESDDSEDEEDDEEEKKVEHSEEGEKDMPEDSKKEKTVEDVFNELTEEQKNVVYAIIGHLLQKGGTAEMKHNVFDNDYDDVNVLSHAEELAIIKDGQNIGSLKDAVLKHTDEYGIMELESQFGSPTYGINALFPDYRELNTPPEFLKRDTDWVASVMNAVHRTPFSRIKTTFADITGDQARALGYFKGYKKKEEVFTLLKRSTDPQTVYKLQKLDRDDIVDITSFDVVAWIKGEMRIMLNEEIARAILIGDGRPGSDQYKISEDHIRSVWKDAELFSIHVATDINGLTPAQKAKNFIITCIKARKDYKGSGNPVLFTTEDNLTEMLLLEDNIGRPLYDSETQLATKLRVSRIITVPVMENQTREVDGVTRTLDGIIVNLKDYNIGADKGGAVNLFDDFDIKFNQFYYLIETRCSGALIKPKAAIVLESYTSAESEETEDETDDNTDDNNGGLG